MKIILASASPRRLELLKSVNVCCTVIPPDICEDPLVGESAEDMVLRLALAKAEVVALQNPDALVIAGDTTVLLDSEILGKPLDRADAIRMLSTMSGRWHRVFSATAVRSISRRVDSSFCSNTDVKFSPISIAEIEQYVESGEPLDKAGSYGAQGLGAQFIEEIKGSYTNVVGLDLCRLMKILRPLITL